MTTIVRYITEYLRNKISLGYYSGSDCPCVRPFTHKHARAQLEVCAEREREREREGERENHLIFIFIFKDFLSSTLDIIDPLYLDFA